MSLLDAQKYLNYVAGLFPAMGILTQKYLALDATIVHNHTFHTGANKILNDAEHQLNPLERNALIPFLKPVFYGPANIHEQKDADDPIESLLQKRGVDQISDSAYYSLSFIPPTSCDVERLFSISRHILTFDREALSPKDFEELIFLRINQKYWNGLTLTELCDRHSSKEDDD